MKLNNCYDPADFNLKVKRYSAHYAMCLCPFHHDTTPSFSFSLTTGDYICFSCHVVGNVQDLATRQGIKIIQRNLQNYETKREDYSWRVLYNNELAYNDAYLKTRQVDNVSVAYYNILANRNAVLFPFYDLKNELMGIGLRLKSNSKLRYILRGKKPPIYPLNRIYDYPTHETIIVTEGVFGAIRMRQFGYNSIALLGSTVSTEAVKWIKRFTQPVLFLDYDVAGLKATLQIKKEVPHVSSITGHLIEADRIDERKLHYLVNYQRQYSLVAMKTMLDMVTK